ncbi:MAG: hypothetical protein ACNA8H_06670 [Anaerolineales bacterium]
MKPFYSRFNTNFGDHLNSWLWKRLCPDLTDDNKQLRLIGVGTLLSRDLDLVPGKKVVFGSGAGYASPPTVEQAASWDIRALRGPLTAKIMGIDEGLAITDAAWLVALLPEYRDSPTQKSGVSFVPHWRTSERAGFFYHSRNYVKPTLRDARTITFSTLTKTNIPGIKSWDEPHAKKLCQILKNLCKLKPSLSKDAVREEKIERLSAAFLSMRRDYKEK